MFSTFAERLKKLRLSYGYDQKYMADLIDVTPVAYGRYEAGMREPKLTVVTYIASYFCISTDWLLGRTADADTQNEVFYYRSVIAFMTDPITTPHDITTFQHDIAGHENDYHYCSVALRAVEYNRDHPIA